MTDALRIVTQPIGVWHGPGDSDELLDHLAGLVGERTVATFVIGFPYNMDGTEGPRAEQVNAFIERVRARFPAVSVAKQDERLSTKEAESLLREAGHFGDERKARRDSWSALVILRDWLAAGEPQS